MRDIRTATHPMSEGPINSHRDEALLEEFLHQIRPRLRALFARYRIPLQDTEDILQQGLLALVYQWRTIREPEAWLLGTLKKRCLLYWRDNRRRLYEVVDATVLDWLAGPRAPEQESSDFARDLRMVIERLPPRCRKILLLRYRLGYDASEVAERLGYSPASMGKVTTRCLAALTRQLTLAGLLDIAPQPARKGPQRSTHPTF